MAENQTRWWEFYAVRYAMGTVVGAIALLFLAPRGTRFNHYCRERQ
jgi:hypothetical protein